MPCVLVRCMHATSLWRMRTHIAAVALMSRVQGGTVAIVDKQRLRTRRLVGSAVRITVSRTRHPAKEAVEVRTLLVARTLNGWRSDSKHA